MSLKYIIGAILGTLVKAGCVQVASKEPLKLTQKQITAIEEDVRYGMIDPTSTMFRNIRGYNAVLSDGKTYQYVCGEVNSKNRMGGYVGFSAFKGQIKDEKFIVEYVDSMKSSLAQIACSH